MCLPDSTDDSSAGLPNQSLRNGFRDVVHLSNSGALHGAADGLGAAAGGPQALHPIQRVQAQSLRKAENARMARAAALYGLHAPLRMRMERELLCQTQRLPGGPRSSLLGLEVIMGRDDELDISDYLNPRLDGPEDPLGAACSVHDFVERRFFGTN